MTVLSSTDTLIAVKLNELDDNLQKMATYIATGAADTADDGDGTEGAAAADGSQDVSASESADIAEDRSVVENILGYDPYEDGDKELGSGDLYAISAATTKIETQAKVFNKAGFAPTEQMKNNADMVLQR
jgi:hypothetical protein